MADVFVVGSLNADHRVRVASIPNAGETVLGSEVVVGPGGKGANQAVAASRAGATVTMIGASGDDPDGELIGEALARQGIDTKHLHIVAGARTGRALITVDREGSNAIVVSVGANAQLTEQHISAGLRDMAEGDILLLQLETPETLVRHAARTAAAAGGVVVLNVAPVPDSTAGLFDDVDVVVVNEHELAGIARQFSGQHDDDMVLLAAAASADVICTLGSDGANVLPQHGRVQHIDAPVVETVDTTAAGDTFIGYLAAGLAENATDLIGASRKAVRAAALAVTREGAIDSIPFGTKGHA